MFYKNYKNYFDPLSNIPLVHSLPMSHSNESLQEIKEKKWKNNLDIIGTDTVVSIKRNKIKIKSYNKDKKKSEVLNYNIIIPDLINRNSIKASIKGKSLSIYGIYNKDYP